LTLGANNLLDQYALKGPHEIVVANFVVVSKALGFKWKCLVFEPLLVEGLVLVLKEEREELNGLFGHEGLHRFGQKEIIQIHYSF